MLYPGENASAPRHLDCQVKHTNYPHTEQLFRAAVRSFELVVPVRRASISLLRREICYTISVHWRIAFRGSRRSCDLCTQIWTWPLTCPSRRQIIYHLTLICAA